MANPTVFARRIAARARGVELRSGDAAKDAAAAALVALVRHTPVGGPPTSPRDPHPGLARSNWHVLPGEQSATGMRAPVSEGEAVAAGIAAARALAGADRTVSISNVVPYINRLNDGWSSQAPAGFVGIALRAASRAVRGVRLLQRLPRRVR